MNNRSILYMPANKEHFIQKITELNADAVTLDLEDSVPLSEKQKARILINNYIEYLSSAGVTIYVRINSWDTGLAELDLDSVVFSGIRGVCFPKVRKPDEIKKLDYKLQQLEHERGLIIGSIKIQVLIENSESVMNSYQIAKSSQRISSLLFGVVDFTEDIEVPINQPCGNEQTLARHTVVCSAVAVNALPIDCPYMNIKDLDGFSKDTEYSHSIGFKGRIVIHPSQIGIANKTYSISKKTIERAKLIVGVYENEVGKGNGSIMLNGEMIAHAVYKSAKDILGRNNA